MYTVSTIGYHEKDIPAFMDFENISKWSQSDRQHVCLGIFVDSEKIIMGVSSLNRPEIKIYSDIHYFDKTFDFFNEIEKVKNIFIANDCQVLFSVMSVAGSISHDHVMISTLIRGTHEQVILFNDLPYEIFPLDRRLFINDTVTAAYGIISIHENGNLSDYFLDSWNQQSKENISLDGTSIVLSFGSKNGVAFIIEDEIDHQKRVISSELSHSQIQTQNMNEIEKEFVKFISQKIYASAFVPEWDDVSSYRGLELAYAFVNPHLKDSIYLDENHNDGDHSTEYVKFSQIQAMAASGDKGALKAYILYYRMITYTTQFMSLALSNIKRIFLISTEDFRNKKLISLDDIIEITSYTPIEFLF
ncbi:hypothetical protein TRFO_12621 [Tritrichomonas foetus]|uniref:Uncharacterized protein n=1 Tax=Tritrichomonas foetus TaxID=1144522 RepID=A0A1J4L598_9EUKA|nr:hypothetical protein TRFO_12621 [Tritrichomonas foetus]|eukprot:OHT17109.1 hypothetical protein TRFO_12621 [Tritrichomonas foetus]